MIWRKFILELAKANYFLAKDIDHDCLLMPLLLFLLLLLLLLAYSTTQQVLAKDKARIESANVCRKSCFLAKNGHW